MANLFINLPCPAGDGVGAPVDVSTLGGVRTISAAGPFLAAVNIEMSNEIVPTKWAPLATFNRPDGMTITVAARWMRCRVSGYRSGAPSVNVGSSDSGALFAALPATPGDGWGPAIDVSALGLYKTVHVGGPFLGNVQIEVSEDGANFWSQIGFGFSNPGKQSEIVAAKFARVRRVGVPAGSPGVVPVIYLGGTDIGSGGGGGGGGAGLLCWGVDNMGAAADSRFVPPGHDFALASLTDVFQLPVTRAGTLRNLYARHNSAAGNGNNIVYTIMVNGVATAITVALATGAVGQANNLINTVAVLAGDRVSLRGAKAAGVGGGGVNLAASVEFN